MLLAEGHGSALAMGRQLQDPTLCTAVVSHARLHSWQHNDLICHSLGHLPLTAWRWHLLAPLCAPSSAAPPNGALQVYESHGAAAGNGSTGGSGSGGEGADVPWLQGSVTLPVSACRE